MSVKCGNRKAHNGAVSYHANAGEVRACYSGRGAESVDVANQRKVAEMADWTRKNFSPAWHAERGLPAPEFVSIDARSAAPGDFVLQGGEWLEVASVAHLRSNTKFSWVGGGSHCAPSHHWGSIRRRITPSTPVPPLAEERSFDDVFAEHEARQERAAYESKMARDDAMRQAAMEDATDESGREIRGALRMPTEPMLKLIADLREERGLAPLKFSGTFSQARVEINRLKELPRVKAATGSAPVKYPLVDDGRYAIVVDGVTKFYRVRRVENRNRPGSMLTFLDVQASDEWHPIKAASAKLEILKAIAADPKAAMLRYGNEIGSCGKCGRTLTDDDSRTRGIGPICAAKLGW